MGKANPTGASLILGKVKADTVRWSRLSGQPGGRVKLIPGSSSRRRIDRCLSPRNRCYDAL